MRALQPGEMLSINVGGEGNYRSNKLKPGPYTLQITATDAKHKRSLPTLLTVTIVK